MRRGDKDEENRGFAPSPTGGMIPPDPCNGVWDAGGGETARGAWRAWETLRPFPFTQLGGPGASGPRPPEACLSLYPFPLNNSAWS